MTSQITWLGETGVGSSSMKYIVTTFVQYERIYVYEVSVATS